MTSVIVLIIFLSAAVLLVPFFKKIGLGSVLGYLLAGILIGPSVLNLVWEPESFTQLADFGVIFLMFIIGLELSPKRLWILRHSIFVLGGLQVVLTTALFVGALVAFGVQPVTAFFVGFALSMSSTAIVLQSLAERQQLGADHGRKTFAVTLFQDIAVIPVLLFLPLVGTLGGQALESHEGPAHVLQWEAALGVLFAVVVGGLYLVRPLLRWVTKSKQTEIFTAICLLLILGAALLFEQVGLSMALGTFLVGVLLAESEFRHEIESTIEPFKGLLLGLFFIMVGVNLDLSVLREQPTTVVGGILGLFVIKILSLQLVGFFTRQDSKVRRKMSVFLSMGGEFGFVLFSMLVDQGALSPEQSNLLTVVVSGSLLLAPLVFVLEDRISIREDKKLGKSRPYDEVHEENPVIIAGFGRYGQILARILMMKKIKFTALDKSVDQVDFVRRFGNKIFYGDASKLDLLRAAKAESAKLFILAIDSVEESLKTAEMMKKHFPQVPIVARARNRNHYFRLRQLGLEHIVRENFHSSLESAVQMLVLFGTEEPQARKLVEKFRVYDEGVLSRQFEFHTDEKKLIEMAKTAMFDLEQILDEDSQNDPLKQD